MKTSNKILLGIFITIIILTTVIQVMVYARYKRGEFVKFNRDAIIKMTSVDLPVIRFISIKGLSSCLLKPGEKYKLDIQKEKVSRMTYQIVNDTLIITGDPKLTFDELEHGKRNGNPVNIYLPAPVPIKVSYSNIRLNGSIDSVSAPSYNIQLGKNSHLSISNRGTENTAVYLKELTLQEQLSGVDLDNNFIIDNINLRLQNARFNDNGATIKNMTIEADKSSTISLTGNNVKALK